MVTRLDEIISRYSGPDAAGVVMGDTRWEQIPGLTVPIVNLQP